VNRETGEKVAIKVINLTKETTADILNEIDILARARVSPLFEKNTCVQYPL
jgi:hypothetical protein